MTTYTLTNDKTFRKMLEKLDDDKLRQLGWKHISPYKMLITLVEYNIDLAYFLVDFEYGFIIQANRDYDLVSDSIKEYLRKMHRAELKELYRDFTDLAEILEDLFDLIYEDRIQLIADIWNWDKNDVELMDLILPN